MTVNPNKLGGPDETHRVRYSEGDFEEVKCKYCGEPVGEQPENTMRGRSGRDVRPAHKECMNTANAVKSDGYDAAQYEHKHKQ